MTSPAPSATNPLLAEWTTPDEVPPFAHIRPEHFREAVINCHDRGAEAVLLLPRVYHEEKAEELKKYCDLGHKAGVNGFLAGNPGTV